MLGIQSLYKVTKFMSFSLSFHELNLKKLICRLIRDNLVIYLSIIAIDFEIKLMQG